MERRCIQTRSFVAADARGKKSCHGAHAGSGGRAFLPAAKPSGLRKVGVVLVVVVVVAMVLFFALIILFRWNLSCRVSSSLFSTHNFLRSGILQSLTRFLFGLVSIQAIFQYLIQFFFRRRSLNKVCSCFYLRGGRGKCPPPSAAWEKLQGLRRICNTGSDEVASGNPKERVLLSHHFHKKGARHESVKLSFLI